MEAEKLTKYIISVKTGSTKHGGTDADIFITITGSKGRSRPMELDNMFHDDFEAGQMDMFEVEGCPVGDILTVQVMKISFHLIYYSCFRPHQSKSIGISKCYWYLICAESLKKQLKVEVKS